MTARSGQILPVRFYARPAAVVARALLGMHLVSEVGARRSIGRIVETEAYTGPDDDASHAAARIGRTARNESMFGPPGRAYVYRIYGVHWCLNFVTDTTDHPAAVLIRAIEPLEGLDVMRARRDRDDLVDAHLGSGPGNLCKALGVSDALDGHVLQELPLYVVEGRAPDAGTIKTSARVGVTRARDLPLRFFLDDSPSVSGRRRRTAS